MAKRIHRNEEDTKAGRGLGFAPHGNQAIVLQLPAIQTKRKDAQDQSVGQATRTSTTGDASVCGPHTRKRHTQVGSNVCVRARSTLMMVIGTAATARVVQAAGWRWMPGLSSGEVGCPGIAQARTCCAGPNCQHPCAGVGVPAIVRTKRCQNAASWNDELHWVNRLGNLAHKGANRSVRARPGLLASRYSVLLLLS
jgi:hypothetical protein